LVSVQNSNAIFSGAEIVLCIRDYMRKHYHRDIDIVSRYKHAIASLRQSYSVLSEQTFPAKSNVVHIHSRANTAVRKRNNQIHQNKQKEHNGNTYVLSIFL
jgi:ElaB/YqjD/DUF883 family membrane-anchored ribosome-binding protein